MTVTIMTEYAVFAKSNSVHAKILPRGNCSGRGEAAGEVLVLTMAAV